MDELQTQKPKSFFGGSTKLAFIVGLLVGIAVVSLVAFILLSLNIKIVGPKTGEATNEQPEQQLPSDLQGMEAKVVGQVGTFFEVSESICKSNNKPLVIMFSTSWCPHCQWAKPLFQEAVKDYVKQGKIIAHNWELDTNDDALTEAKETTVPQDELALYEKYNPEGTIPTFIFGCKYYRVGTGHEKDSDTAAETQEFKELIDELLK